MAGTYRITVQCTNCEQGLTEIIRGEVVFKWIKIPKGTTVEKFLRDKKCENCGCKNCLIGRK